MSILEIERAIKQLSREEFNNLMKWLSDYENQIWDKQIEEDYKDGRLNKLIDNALADIKDGNFSEL